MKNAFRIIWCIFLKYKRVSYMEMNPRWPSARSRLLLYLESTNLLMEHLTPVFQFKVDKFTRGTLDAGFRVQNWYEFSRGSFQAGFVLGVHVPTRDHGQWRRPNPDLERHHRSVLPHHAWQQSQRSGIGAHRHRQSVSRSSIRFLMDF